MYSVTASAAPEDLEAAKLVGSPYVDREGEGR